MGVKVLCLLQPQHALAVAGSRAAMKESLCSGVAEKDRMYLLHEDRMR